MTHSATSGDPVRDSGASTAGNPSGPGLPNDVSSPRAVRLLLFAAARQAAGTRQADMRATTLADLLDQARARFGDTFSAVLEGCRVWVNGEPAAPTTSLSEGDEIAVLPPVSGG